MILKEGTQVILSNVYSSSEFYEDIQGVAGTICTIGEYDKAEGLYEIKELSCYGCEWDLNDFEEVLTDDYKNKRKWYVTPNPRFQKNPYRIDVPVKQLREDAILPKYAHGYEDSGMDVFVCKIAVKVEGEWEEYTKYKLAPNETVLVKIGWAFAVPTHYELQARPTSGNSLKTMLRVANSPGTIDAGYRGEVGIILTNTGDEYVSIHQSDKVAQLVLCPVYHADLSIVDELPEANRGEDGYGSTGTIKDVK